MVAETGSISGSTSNVLDAIAAIHLESQSLVTRAEHYARPSLANAGSRREMLSLVATIGCALGLLLTLSAGASPGCVPYKPDVGLFFTTSTFQPLPSPGSATCGTKTFPHSTPQGSIPSFMCYGSNSRFLLLLDTTPGSTSVIFQVSQVDLLATTPVERQLVRQTFFTSEIAQVHAQPSPGNGLAVLVWIGRQTAVDTVPFSTIFRSDTAASLCSAPPWSPQVQVIGQVTTTSVRIKDGGNLPAIQECSLPSPGKLSISPSTLSFASNVTLSTTFRNSGSDCVDVNSVSSSQHFRPMSPPSIPFTLAGGASQSVTIEFHCDSDTGVFNETLAVTSTPSGGTSSINVSGTCVPPTLVVKKKLSPSTDPGRFNLQIDNTTRRSDARDGDSTPAQGVTLGNHTVGEIAGTGTNLSDYITTIDCGTGPVSVGGQTSRSRTVNVTRGTTTCTITNVGPQLTVSKVLRPPSDPGRFNLQIDTVTRRSDAGDGDSTGPQSVKAGSHTVGEIAGTATNLADYQTTIDCGSGPVNGTSVPVSVSPGQAVTCTITNLGPPQLTVTKALRPRNDPGLFNLQIDGVTKKADARDRESTGPQRVSAGNHTVSETAGTGTDLANYKASINCGTTTACQPCTSLPVALSQGEAITCTITNLGLPRLTICKTLVPAGDAGLFNLRIDGTVIAANVGTFTTAPQVVTPDVNHTVGETAGTNTSLNDYTTALDGACDASGTINLSWGDDKVCSITNVGADATCADMCRPTCGGPGYTGGTEACIAKCDAEVQDCWGDFQDCFNERDSRGHFLHPRLFCLKRYRECQKAAHVR